MKSIVVFFFLILATSCNFAQTTISYMVASSSDDAEERVDGNIFGNVGKVSLNSPDLEFVHDTYVIFANEYNQIIGIRFRNIDLPSENIVIESAYIQFFADADDDEQTLLQINGELNPHSNTFTETDFDISSRPKTMSTSYWDMPAWIKNDAGETQKSPDLKNIVQEIISQPGWMQGNAMSFIFSGEGQRIATSWDGSSAKAPKLYITYKNVSEITDHSGFQSLKLFPNPASQQFTLNFGSDVPQNTSVSIIDLNGRVVSQMEFTENLIHISVADIENGLYMVKIIRNNEVITKSLVVKR